MTFNPYNILIIAVNINYESSYLFSYRNVLASLFPTFLQSDGGKVSIKTSHGIHMQYGCPLKGKVCRSVIKTDVLYLWVRMLGS